MGHFVLSFLSVLAIGTISTCTPISTAFKNHVPATHPLSKRLVLKDRECSSSIYQPKLTQAYALADQLVQSVRADCTCTLNRNQSYATVATIDENVQANVWFTGSNPQTISVSWNCTRLADAIYDLISHCRPFSNNDQIGGMAKLSNCLVNQESLEWDGMPANPPMADGGAALEIISVKREASPWHGA